MTKEDFNRRTVAAHKDSPKAEELNGADYLIGKRNKDNHVVLNDVQNCINSFYGGHHSKEYIEKFRIDLLNSLKYDTLLLEKAKIVLNDFETNYIDSEGKPIPVKKNVKDLESRFREFS